MKTALRMWFVVIVAGLFALAFATSVGATGGDHPVFNWQLHSDGCLGDEYGFTVFYNRGNHEHNFHWSDNDGNDGRFWLSPGETHQIVTSGNVVKVNGPGRIRWSFSYEVCDPGTPPKDPPAHVLREREGPVEAFAMIALDVGDPAWVCEGSAIRHDDGSLVITPMQRLYWEPLGTEIPYTIINLGYYIDPAECTIYDVVYNAEGEAELGNAISDVVYGDYDFATFVLYMHTNENSIGVSHRH
jgi:hypothetical protein